nr:MAG TPA: hypothetical protein [Caudoviricetes sp.]
MHPESCAPPSLAETKSKRPALYRIFSAVVAAFLQQPRLEMPTLPPA